MSQQIKENERVMSRRDFLTRGVRRTAEAGALAAAAIVAPGVLAGGDHSAQASITRPEEEGRRLPTAEFLGGDLQTFGVPDRIDPSAVDTAKGPFENTIGLGTQMMFAEPGALHVGPDFGSKSRKNPWGENSQGWDAMYESKGHIQPFSPVTQEVLRYPGPAYQNLPEGGFAYAVSGGMTIQVGDATFVMRDRPNHTWMFFARGMYGDNKQNTDRNGDLIVSEYAPGHVEVGMYEAGRNTNSAFVSEGQFKQMSETVHSGGTNRGDGGSSELSVVMYDANTQAFAVVTQRLGRFENGGRNWESVASNWR